MAGDKLRRIKRCSKGASYGEEILGELSSDEAFSDGSTKVYWSKYVQFDGKWYETTGSYGKTITETGNTDVAYTPSDIAYFVEAEGMNKSRSAAATASGTGYSGGSASRHYSSSQWWTDTFADGGVFTLTFPYSMANASASTVVIKTRDADGNYTATDLSLTASTTGTFSDEITVPAGSSVAICNEYSYNSNILIDYLTLTRKVVSVTIGSTGYASFASPFALDLKNLPEGLTAYYASAVNGEDVVLTAKSDGAVAAGTGLVLKGVAGTYNIPIAATGSAIDGNLLVGCTTATTAYGSTKYVLYEADGVAKFCNLSNYTVSKPMNIPAGKSYLDASTAGVKVLNIIFDDTATGIAEIADGGGLKDDDNAVLYNTAGQVVTKDYKGIVIKNGKKFFNK